jgi:hypothetical protein
VRQAHDAIHDRIRVRRGICKRCGRTVTVLPGWCVPGARYTLTARQTAMTGVARGDSAQQAAPHCRDPNQVADASTVRRWFWRWIESVHFWASPTLLAWDWRAVGRILMAEPISP